MVIAARTRVNEKDALGDGRRDSISGGKYTKLCDRVHVIKSGFLKHSD